MLTKLAQVAAKLEAAEGVAETLAAADVILASNFNFNPDVQIVDRNPLKDNLSPTPGRPGLRMAQLSFDVLLVGASAGKGVAPHYSAALRACGVGETIVALTSVTYNPDSTPGPSATLEYRVDGKIYKMWGARGTVQMKFDDGVPVVMSFTFTAADWSETDGALFAGVTYETALPPVFMNAGLTLGGYSAVLSAMNLDLGAAVTLRKDANASSGYKSARITDRKPTLTLDPENVTVATNDFMGQWKAGTTLALASSIGSGAGQVIAVSAPAAQYQSVSMADRDGMSGFDINALLCGSAGDDEWQIQIT